MTPMGILNYLYTKTLAYDNSLYAVMIITAYHFQVLELKLEQISSDSKRITHLLPPQ